MKYLCEQGQMHEINLSDKQMFYCLLHIPIVFFTFTSHTSHVIILTFKLRNCYCI